MKKIILFILSLILLTGCSADVNIVINDTGINETITIKDTSKTNYYNYVPVFYDDIFSEIEPDAKNEGVKYYNRNVTQDINGYKINYSYKYNFDDYKKARSVKTAFNSFNLRDTKADGEIVISTDSGGLKYFNTYSNLENVRINITPSYKVKTSNADYINGNVYTWMFNKNTKKHIYMVLDNPKKDDSTGNSETTGNSGTTGDNDLNDNNNPSTNEDKDNEGSQNLDNEQDDVPEEETKNQEKEESFLDKYPYVVLFGAIAIFGMFALLTLKVTKSE